MKHPARIPSSTVVAVLALSGSVAAHLAFGAWSGAPALQEVNIAGGGSAQIAVRGSAFADLAAGISTAVVPQTLTAVTAPVLTTPVTTTTATTPPNVTAPMQAVTAATPPVQAAVPLVSTATGEAIAAVEETTPRLSARPVSRTPEVAARAAAQAAKALPRKATPKPAAPRDTAQTNASRGTEGSTPSAQSAATGADRQQAAGTAAASNYPGQIQRRIARQRLPRVRAQGVAQVSFTIAPGGSLASIGLARSSGSAELDREAVNLVRRAAPFPPPPQGAQRSFTIPVRAR